MSGRISLLLLALSGCATSLQQDSKRLGSNTHTTAAGASALAPASVDLSSPPSAWQPMHLPGKRKTHFSHRLHQGRLAIEAVANSSVSMFRRPMNIPAEELTMLNFSWSVPGLITSADMALRESDDSPVRVVLSFAGDRATFSKKNRMLSDLSYALTGEELPYATLMYVWCNQRAAGSVITNPRTDRIRKIVVESGAAHLGRWQDYQRDIRADFIQAFGEQPGALTGIALMTDTDNTQSKATAWYGPVSLGAK